MFCKNCAFLNKCVALSWMMPFGQFYSASSACMDHLRIITHLVHKLSLVLLYTSCYPRARVMHSIAHTKRASAKCCNETAAHAMHHILQGEKKCPRLVSPFPSYSGNLTTSTALRGAAL